MFIQGVPYRHHLDVLHHLFISLCGEVRTTSEPGYQHWQISPASSPLDLPKLFTSGCPPGSTTDPPIHSEQLKVVKVGMFGVQPGADPNWSLMLSPGCLDLVSQRPLMLWCGLCPAKGALGDVIFSPGNVFQAREAWDRWDVWPLPGQTSTRRLSVSPGAGTLNLKHLAGWWSSARPSMTQDDPGWPVQWSLGTRGTWWTWSGAFFRLTDEVSTKIQMSKGPTLHTVEQLVVWINNTHAKSCGSQRRSWFPTSKSTTSTATAGNSKSWPMFINECKAFLWGIGCPCGSLQITSAPSVTVEVCLHFVRLLANLNHVMDVTIVYRCSLNPRRLHVTKWASFFGEINQG